MSTKYFLRYETDEDNTWRQWACIASDRSFAVHVWMRGVEKNSMSGGVESHRNPRDGESPDHEHCPFLNGPCCHDGSSLYFREYWEERLLMAIGDGDALSPLKWIRAEFERRLPDEEASK